MSERLAGNAASALSIYLGIATIAKHHVIHLGWLGPPRPGNGLEVRGLQALGGGWDVMGRGGRRAEGGWQGAAGGRRVGKGTFLIVGFGIEVVSVTQSRRHIQCHQTIFSNRAMANPKQTNFKFELRI